MGIIEQVKQMKLDKAKEEGRTEKEISVVQKLLVSTDFSDVRIADLAGVSVTFVKEVREGKRK
jgi:hypothetical protein